MVFSIVFYSFPAFIGIILSNEPTGVWCGIWVFLWWICIFRGTYNLTGREVYLLERVICLKSIF